MKNIALLFIIFTLFCCSTGNKESDVFIKQVNTRDQNLIVKRIIHKPITILEKSLIDAGLVNVFLLDTNIIVDLKYSSTDNFLGIDLYGDFNNCYLQPDVADKLIQAQKYLNEIKPGYHLLIFDAARPRSIQQKFWDTLKMPVSEKVKFVANPKNGSLHNFGAAVDISIADENRIPLDMGCPYDYIGELAYPTSETKLLSEGKLTQQQVDNRKLLRTVMYKAGFFNIQTEWWHFNSCRREDAVLNYKIIE
jgi:zinc D-Ala-D-Ala dipeptidase